MKVLEQRCDVVALPCWTNEPCSSIHHRLQSVELIACHAGQRRIAVIEACQYQGHHQRLQSLLWDWSTNAADLTHYSEAAGHGSGNMRLHWCVGVDVNTQVTHWWCWHDRVIANSQCNLRYLILSSTRRTPDDLGLGRVELQSIGPHPHRHVVHARRHLLLQLCGACRMTDSVDLLK